MTSRWTAPGLGPAGDRDRVVRSEPGLEVAAGSPSRDEAAFNRSRAALRGRVLRLPPAAAGSQRTLETDAAGRAVQELHDRGETHFHRVLCGRRAVGQGPERRENTVFIFTENINKLGVC